MTPKTRIRKVGDRYHPEVWRVLSWSRITVELGTVGDPAFSLNKAKASIDKLLVHLEVDPEEIIEYPVKAKPTKERRKSWFSIFQLLRRIF